MRAFDYIKEPEKLLTPEIVQMIGKIHEHKGKQELFLEANIDELKTLLEVALIQSTGASNRIEFEAAQAALRKVRPHTKKNKENSFPFYCAHCGRKLQRTFDTDVHFYCWQS